MSDIAFKRLYGLAIEPSHAHFALPRNPSLGWRKYGGIAVGRGMPLASDFEGPPDVMLLVMRGEHSVLSALNPMGLA